jgi:diguanylate cyclase (GGDEF)-like protein
MSLKNSSLFSNATTLEDQLEAIETSSKTVEKLSTEFLQTYAKYEALKDFAFEDMLQREENKEAEPSQTKLNNLYHLCTDVLEQHRKVPEPEFKEILEHTVQELSTYIDEQKESIKSHLERASDTLKTAGIDANTGLLRQERAYDSFRETYVNTAMDVLARGKTGYIGVIFADLDNLKKHNAQYGHHAMDAVIATMGKTIKSTIKEKRDAAIRKGGDEFVVYMTSFKKDGPETYVSKLHHAIQSIRCSLPGYEESYSPTATCGFDQINITYDDAKEIESILLEYNHKIKNAKNGSRSQMFDERNSAIDTVLEPVYSQAIQNANAATYDAKLCGKNQFKQYQSDKQESGYYTYIRNLYNSVVSNELSADEAYYQAVTYTPTNAIE